MRLVSLFRDVLRHRRGVVLHPRFLTYLVTFRCNARCVMCDSWRKPSPDELTLSEIAFIFGQLPRMDVIRLSGGEPFLRPDLVDIAQLAAEQLRPRVLHVTTNGFLTQRIIEFCERRGRTPPLHLLISLDGTQAKHNQVRGRQTAWDTAFATLCVLAPRQRELGLRLAVNQTIVDRDGVQEHRQLRQLIEPLGVRVHAVLAYDASATYNRQAEIDLAPADAGQFSPFGTIDQDSAEDLLTEMETGLAGCSWGERMAKGYYLDGLRSRLLGQQARPNPRCVALGSHLRLLPNGDVPVCHFDSQRVGNLRAESFEALWSGPAIGARREWVRRCAGCWAECEVLPNALHSGDLFGHAAARALLGTVPKLKASAREVQGESVRFAGKGGVNPSSLPRSGQRQIHGEPPVPFWTSK
jgi:MoaA/NifB/PqqE/SkfB family radical SAM enzyme